MKILILILQILAAIAFIMTGMMKIFTTYEDLVLMENMGWAQDFSGTQITIIGILEALGGLSLLLPMLLKKLTSLIPLAALGLALIMVGAIVTHIGRDEPVVVNLVLLLLTLSVAYFKRDLFLNRSLQND
ncbi:MAG: DoxX family protein [Cyclobacteriaceae bacterium]|nr:DoxX family protein [Cyclobacteriaceae bacterium]